MYNNLRSQLTKLYILEKSANKTCEQLSILLTQGFLKIWGKKEATFSTFGGNVEQQREAAEIFKEEISIKNKIEKETTSSNQYYYEFIF